MKQKFVFFAAVFGFAYAVAAPHETNSVPSSTEQDSRFGKPEPRGGEAMVLDRDGRGQFHLSADVDGQPVEFLVDTGADIVALTVEEAERLGLEIDPEGFAPVGQTASGVGNGQVVSLDRLEVAGNEFRDVDAVVMAGLSTNLLGQSILRQLGGVTLEGDQMVIHR